MPLIWIFFITFLLFSAIIYLILTLTYILYMIKSICVLYSNSSPFRYLCNIYSKTLLQNRSLNIKKMSTDVTSVPTVDIDPSGVFKYILIKVYEQNQCSPDPLKILVRGYKSCEYHADIFDKVQETLKPLDLEPIGGGRISHDPENKKIHIYGYSQGYGKADHEITAGLVKEAYPSYTISISDEGY